MFTHPLVTKRRVLFAAASLGLLLVSACEAPCGPAPTYAGRDVLPGEKSTAEGVLARTKMLVMQERSWIPEPSELTALRNGPIPPLPLEGTTTLEIEVMPLSQEFMDTDDSSSWCRIGEYPTAPVRVTVRTSDGVLDEELTGTVSSSGFVYATLTEPKGSIKEYFAGFEAPTFPELKVTLRPGEIRLQLVLEQRTKNGGGFDYVTLL